MDKKSAKKIPKRETRELKINHLNDPYTELRKLHELYSNIQVNSDTIYYNRTSIITLTQGLLFVAFNSLLSHKEWIIANSAVAALGFIIAILWMFFEQRNLVFFKGRAATLRQLETEIEEIAKRDNIPFHSFWKEVPAWVKTNAKWHQRISAQNVLRLWIPLIFASVWAFLFIISIYSINVNKNDLKKFEQKNVIENKIESRPTIKDDKIDTKRKIKKNGDDTTQTKQPES